MSGKKRDTAAFRRGVPGGEKRESFQAESGHWERGWIRVGPVRQLKGEPSTGPILSPGRKKLHMDQEEAKRL